MDLGLRGRGALVGGASRGLGRAVADALAAEGCRVALWSRGGRALEEATDSIAKAHGVETHAIAADAGDSGAADMVVAAARETLGSVDILVLNAGGPSVVDPTATTPDGWRDAFQLLAITPIAVATALLPDMRARRWGRVVAILSASIRQPLAPLVYSTSGRGALAGWLKTVSTAVAADGVTVNGVLPGRIATDRTQELDEARARAEARPAAEVRADIEAGIPVRRYGRPEELASLVAWLCSKQAGYVNGTFIPVDGGALAAM